MEPEFIVEIEGKHHRTERREHTGASVLALVGSVDVDLYRFVDNKWQLVAETDVILLEAHERFEVRHRHHEICFEVDGREYKTRHRERTGAQIKEIASVPAANILYHVTDRKRTEIENDKIVHLHDHEKFMTQPPVGGAS